MQNTIQVIAFILLNLCCLMYGSFQFQQISEALNDIQNNNPALTSTVAMYGVDFSDLKALIDRLLIANVIVIGLCELIYLYLGARLYQEFG